MVLEMAKSKRDILLVAGCVLSVVGIINSCTLLVKDGYARDAGIYVAPWISLTLVLLPGFCISVSILLYWLCKHRQDKLGKWSSVFLVVFLVVVNLTVSFGWKYSSSKNQNLDLQHPQIHQVSLDEFRATMKTNDFQIAYVGCNSCPLCEYILPELIDYLENENLDILYYNTEKDSEKSKDELRTFLQSISVTDVPAIVVISNQIVEETFTGETIVKDLSDYMSHR